MVRLIGFDVDEERCIQDMVHRFHVKGFSLSELDLIEKRPSQDYLGLVVPQEENGRLRSQLYLAAALPFTIAHELAHVADIAIRQAETLDHIAARMPRHWHLAHRMGSEYYANRVACGFCTDDQVFPAFQNDRIGMIAAARNGEWADFLINYAMLLGIFHGFGRLDIEPLELLPEPYDLPETVERGMAAFRNEAAGFFDNYSGDKPAQSGGGQSEIGEDRESHRQHQVVA